MSYARVHLGMGREEFLDCTPRYFDALAKQHRRKMEYEALQFARLESAIINFGCRAPEKPVTARQLLGLKARRRKRSQHKINEELHKVFTKAFARSG